MTLGRAALAGVLSAIFLLATRSPLPRRAPMEADRPWRCWATSSAFRCCWRYALRVVSASHAAVITALLPLATAACAAWVLHQRARARLLALRAGRQRARDRVFACCARATSGAGFGFAWADLLLVGAVFAASLGYVYGAQVTSQRWAPSA